MKILCFSDSHGSFDAVGEMLKKHRDAQAVFFLGDGLTDAEYHAASDTERAWIAVRGNCDFTSSFRSSPALKVDGITLEGYKFVLTHGDAYGVKSSLYGLMELAEEREADVVLFGHTHSPLLELRTIGERAVYFFNPGSIKEGYLNPSSYGIIELCDGAIRLTHGTL